MSNSIKFDPPLVGIDLGSSYVKAVLLDKDGNITRKFLRPTGYDFSTARDEVSRNFGLEETILGVTGYGRHQVQAEVCKTEISALAKALTHRGIKQGTLIDIGGQDSKVLTIKDNRLEDQALNRRCAAGTGSYLEFAAQRLRMEACEMNQLAGEEKEYHPLNTFCTVFAGTEILDCLNKKIPLPRLVRGLYVSVVERIKEMSALEPPLYLSGGVIAHHPVLAGVFEEITGTLVKVMKDPQFLAAQGIALFAFEELKKEKEPC